MSNPWKPGRRTGLVLGAVSALSALCLMTALTGAAIASPESGVKGDPQPELQPFDLGPAASAGTVAIEPNGSLIAAYDIKGGNGKTLVCLLNRGERGCSQKVALNPPSGDSTFGTPQVFVTSASHVIVLQQTCCDSDTAGSDVIYSSTNGGKTFSAPVRVGTLGVNSAAVVGNDLLFVADDDNSGLQVQSVQVKPSLQSNGPVVTAQAKTAFDVGITNDHGGALVASDFLGKSGYTTYVEYAGPTASPFTTAGSFAKVATIDGEQLLGISGRALLTVETGGKHWVRVRLFTGTKFGAPHNMPGSSGGGPEWFAVDQDPSGAVHVFSDRGLAHPAYDLLEYTTSNGTKWDAPVDLGHAIQSTAFSAGLDSHGSGLVLGTQPAWGYPVLGTQSVSFSLKSSNIKKGKSTTGFGKGNPAATGRRITLQVQGKSGNWFNVATTHEKSGGSFSFTIKGKSDGTFRYRAVAADLAGYLQFGYSNAKPLRVTG
jgi:hypothetical protein